MLAEFTYPYKEEEPPMETWTIQTNGSTMKKVGGAGIVLISPEKETLKYAVRLQFPRTNNEAEVLRAKNLIV